MTLRRAIETVEHYGYSLVELGPYTWKLTGHGADNVIGEQRLVELAREIDPNE